MKSIFRKGAFLLSILIICRSGFSQTHSQLVSYQCGEQIPLNTYNGYFFFEYVPQAEDYRMTVLSMGGPFYYKSVISGGADYIPMLNFADMEANRTYSVVIDIKVNGSWNSSGPTCNISTLEYSPSLLIQTQCGEALSLEGSFAFDEIEYATDYRMAAIYTSGNPFYFKTVESGGSRFVDRSEFSDLQFGLNYIVRVQIKFNGMWLPYGPNCLITVDEGGLRQSRTPNSSLPRPEISIYPNPSNGDGFNMELSNLPKEQNKVQISIYDMIGKEVYNNAISQMGNNLTLDLGEPQLTSGVYLVKVNVGSETFTERIKVE